MPGGLADLRSNPGPNRSDPRRSDPVGVHGPATAMTCTFRPMPGVHEPLTDALLDAATYEADVHVVLDRLRAEAPLAWNGTKGFWAVTRHADVSEASSDPSRFCSAKGILLDEIGVTYDSPPTMMHADPPEHTRYRKLARPGFTNAVVRQLEVLVRERTGARPRCTRGEGGRRRRGRRHRPSWRCRCPSSSSPSCSACRRATRSGCSGGPRRPSRVPPTGPRTSATRCSAR